jgi:hypothetical protein
MHAYFHTSVYAWTVIHHHCNFLEKNQHVLVTRRMFSCMNRCMLILAQDTVSCIPCTSSCPSGWHLTGECSGLSRSNDVSCAPCTLSCPAQHYMAGECNGKTKTNSVSCQPCKTCVLGQYMATACNGLSNSDVTVCKVNFMSFAYGHMVQDPTLIAYIGAADLTEKVLDFVQVIRCDDKCA